MKLHCLAPRLVLLVLILSCLNASAVAGPAGPTARNVPTILAEKNTILEGALRGGLIGACVGAVVGAIIYVTKKKDKGK